MDRAGRGGDPSRPLRVPDLVREAVISASAFHAHFRAATGTTPLQFQKQLRLLEARARLRAGAPLTAAAFAVGYAPPDAVQPRLPPLFLACPRARIGTRTREAWPPSDLRQPVPPRDAAPR
jgi:AraC-like DNA-binding protein